MNQMFGICHHSITMVYDGLVEAAKRYNFPIEEIALVERHTKTLPKKKVLFFTEFTALFNHRKDIKGKKAILIITDAMPQLYGLDGIDLIDSEPGVDGLSYQFRIVKLGKSQYNRIIKSAMNAQALDYGYKEFEVIPLLIEKVKDGTLLDKLNNVIYRTSDLFKQKTIKLSILNVLQKSMTIDQFEADMKKMFNKGLALTYVETLVEFLRSKQGKSYITVISDGIKNRSKVEKLAEKHKVDQFEARYLFKLADSLQKDLNFDTNKPVQDLKDTVKKQGGSSYNSHLSKEYMQGVANDFNELLDKGYKLNSKPNRPGALGIMSKKLNITVPVLRDWIRRNGVMERKFGIKIREQE